MESTKMPSLGVFGDTYTSPQTRRHDPESHTSCYKPWKAKSGRRIYRLGIVLGAYAVVLLLITAARVRNEAKESPVISRIMDNDIYTDFGASKLLQRQKRDVVLSTDSGITLHKSEPRNCTVRSVKNFPSNFLSFEQTRNGGVVLHILIALYMFAALAVICDDYFVPALEHICEDLGLQADVAGATFMAAGSSAPEFMTSVVGVFFAESDVGTGTIVGSAVFNILFIVGICGVFAGMVIELTWYPLVRDTLYYLLSVLTLFLIIMDQSVRWYEAMIMVILYFFYILLMYFNRTLEAKSKAWVRRMLAKFGRQPLVDKPQENVIPDDMKRARAHSRISQSSMSLSMSREYEKPPANCVDTPVLPEEQETSIESSIVDAALPNGQSKNNEPITVSEYESIWEIPDSIVMKTVFFIMCPVKLLFFVTVPDSRRPGIWSRLYIVSFVASVAWISGLTYIMVWMVTIAGDALDIPDTVMGLTLLAAGTSVPDCLASVFVARDGYGDMAVSNSLGSNVFDILLCLGLPWLIESLSNNGDSVYIASQGLIYSSLTLLATVAFLLISVGFNKWKLTKPYGCLCLFAYTLVVVLSCLYELNVFGDLNPPSCPR